MRTITKALTAGVALAALGLVSLHAVAQPGHGPMGGGPMGGGPMGGGMGMMMHGGMGMGPGGMGPGGMGQLTDPAERLAAAKSAIGIKPEQSAAWDVYAKVVTDVATERREHREKMDHSAVREMKPEDRQAFMASQQKQRDDAFAKVKAAAEALTATLDETQKVKARQSLPGLAVAGAGDAQGMPHGMRMGQGMHMGMGMGRGMGGMGPGSRH